MLFKERRVGSVRAAAGAGGHPSAWVRVTPPLLHQQSSGAVRRTRLRVHTAALVTLAAIAVLLFTVNALRRPSRQLSGGSAHTKQAISLAQGHHAQAQHGTGHAHAVPAADALNSKRLELMASLRSHVVHQDGGGGGNGAHVEQPRRVAYGSGLSSAHHLQVFRGHHLGGGSSTYQCDPRASNWYADGPLPDPALAAKQKVLPLWWNAPFMDKTSFGMEAATMLLGAVKGGVFPAELLWLGTTEGNCNYRQPETGFGPDDFDLLESARRRATKCMTSIVVCHSLPPFWSRPKNKWDTCQPCPPIGYAPAVTVGRAMAETDRFHPEFVRQCNRMDEVWVPSEFSAQVLRDSGVTEALIRVLPIAVDTDAHDPARVAPLPLPLGDLVFGRPQQPPKQPRAAQARTRDTQVASAQAASAAHLSVEEFLRQAGHRQFPTQQDGRHSNSGSGVRAGQSAAGVAANATDDGRLRRKGRTLQRALGGAGGAQAGGAGSGGEQKRAGEEDATRPQRRRPFVFTTCFKWEARKGWDLLLSAYLQEFTSDDAVELYILTKPFLDGTNIVEQMHAWAATHLNVTGAAGRARLPTLYVMSGHIEEEKYNQLYKAADAFVMATRGEGWGMPLSEAMAMGLPVVVTNWSGPVAFVDESVGYPVNYTLVEVPESMLWWFRGARWAEVDIAHMRRRLREVSSDPEEAKRRGRAARQRMVEKYSPVVVGRLLVAEYDRLVTMVKANNCSHCKGRRWVAPPGDTAIELYNGNEPFLKPDENVWGARKHLADGAQSAFRDFRRSSEALQALQRAGTLHLAHATGAGNR